MKKSAIALMLAGASLCLPTQAQDKHNQIVVGQEAFIDIIRELNVGYVDSIDNETLITNAINAMLASLDPYTVYVPAEKDDYLKQMTTGDMGGGIGELIAGALAENAPTPIEFINGRDRWGQAGTPAELMEAYGLNAGTIAAAAVKVIGRK